jgi:hypothetical protein
MPGIYLTLAFMNIMFFGSQGEQLTALKNLIAETDIDLAAAKAIRQNIRMRCYETISSTSHPKNGMYHVSFIVGHDYCKE